MTNERTSGFAIELSNYSNEYIQGNEYDYLKNRINIFALHLERLLLDSESTNFDIQLTMIELNYLYNSISKFEYKASTADELIKKYENTVKELKETNSRLQERINTLSEQCN